MNCCFYFTVYQSLKEDGSFLQNKYKYFLYHQTSFLFKLRSRSGKILHQKGCFVAAVPRDSWPDLAMLFRHWPKCF